MRTIFSLLALQWTSFLRLRVKAYSVLQFGLLLVFFFALAFPSMEKLPLTLLFWTTILFQTFQSANFFLHQYSLANLIFFFTMTSPLPFFLTHLFFYWLFNTLSGYLIYFLYRLFFPNWSYTGTDLIVLPLVLLGITNVLIFLTFVTYKAQKQVNLIPILTIPLLLPKLLLTVQYSQGILPFFKAFQYIGGLVLIYFLVSIAFFPLLWSDS